MADETFNHGYNEKISFVWYLKNEMSASGRLLDSNLNTGGYQGNHYEPWQEDNVYLLSAMIVDLAHGS